MVIRPQTHKCLKFFENSEIFRIASSIRFPRVLNHFCMLDICWDIDFFLQKKKTFWAPNGLMPWNICNTHKRGQGNEWRFSIQHSETIISRRKNFNFVNVSDNIVMVYSVQELIIYKAEKGSECSRAGYSLYKSEKWIETRCHYYRCWRCNNWSYLYRYLFYLPELLTEL